MKEILKVVIDRKEANLTSHKSKYISSSFEDETIIYELQSCAKNARIKFISDDQLFIFLYN